MARSRFRRIEALFHAAERLPPEEARSFLARECAGDRQLEREVGKLLSFSHRPGPLDQDDRRRYLHAVADPDPPEPLDPQPPRLSPRYRVLELLGRGGMGCVWLVEDRRLARRVALKTVSRLDPEHGRRFEREVRATACLQHPGIVPVYEVGISECGRPYYIMPVVEGRSLRSVLDELRGAGGGPSEWSLIRLTQIFIQVTQAVSHAHARGVIHRDLKPSNIMLGEHGKVLVVDWGLTPASRVTPDTGTGTTGLAGTPAYIAPELVKGGPANHQSDVYSLGVLLYELLCLRPPFEGSSSEVLEAQLHARPVPPSGIESTRPVPRALEDVCLEALRKDPLERLQGVEALGAAVDSWLQAENERSLRHQRADEKAGEARRILEHYRRLKRQLDRLQRQTQRLAGRYKSWEPAEQKRPLCEAQARLRKARRLLVSVSSRVVTTGTEALGIEAANPTARALLADYYWERAVEDEDRGDTLSADFHRELVARLDHHRFRERLEGHGSLTLSSNPPGAELWLSRLVEDGFVLRPGPVSRLGATPLDSLTLPMGSYLATLRHPGAREVRYPVRITRNRAWVGHVNLYTEEQIGDGFVYVPGGPFPSRRPVEGSHRWVTVELPDFFIARRLVLLGDYLDYLNALARSRGLRAARRRAPRPSERASTALVTNADGRLCLPARDHEGDPLDPNYPVVGISWHDAVAYAGWRSRRDGRRYRLPSERQWEKAAYGVDGRRHPWGDAFDASLCNMADSLRERPALTRPEDFPQDCSVYGVMGMAGNVQDWTSSRVSRGEGGRARVLRVQRGGCWCSDLKHMRDSRILNEPFHPSSTCGFRLAASPPPVPGDPGV